ncbi:MAG: hypothetical protein ACKPKO_50870 [Candidatus Fonsibacter sp.]
MEIVVAGLLSKDTPTTRSSDGDRCGGTVVERRAHNTLHLFNIHAYSSSLIAYNYLIYLYAIIF